MARVVRSKDFNTHIDREGGRGNEIGIMAIKSGHFKNHLFAILLAVSPYTLSAGASEPLPNANIVRSSQGEYTYQTLKEHRPRGRETWSLTVHPDGSRTVTALVDNYDGGVYYNLVHRVDADFRPLESFVVQWMTGRRLASAHFAVDGNTLTSTIATTTGRRDEQLNVPNTFSIQPHAVVTDGWRGYWYDKAKRGVQSGTNVNMSVAPGTPEPLRGKLEEENAEYIGSERITVPAGTFDTEHYKFRGGADIWFTSQDRLMIRYLYVETDREYVLTKITRTH